MGHDGSGNTQFIYPLDIAVNTSGFVYVADTSNHRIQVFTSGGSYVTQWGTSGTGPFQFNYPRGIAVNGSGYVYVADTGSNRTQVFTPDGVYVAQWGTGGTGPPPVLFS